MRFTACEACQRAPHISLLCVGKFIVLYARDASTGDIPVGELYGIRDLPVLVSAVNDSVIDEVTAWLAAPLESSYAIVFFDSLRAMIRDEVL